MKPFVVRHYGTDERPDGQTAEPLALRLNDQLGPLPEPDMSHEKARDDREEETSYSAEAVKTERQRCYELGMAAERKRWITLCKDLAADNNPPHKEYEDTYNDGWLDACNEILWAGEETDDRQEAN